MKHSSECFILHLKQMCILGENWEESWVDLCKFFLTYPNSISVLISFVFILWIINSLDTVVKNAFSFLIYYIKIVPTFCCCFQKKYERMVHCGIYAIGLLVIFIELLISVLENRTYNVWSRVSEENWRDSKLIIRLTLRSL